MKERPAHDISLRLPEERKFLKKELVKIAKKNNLTLNNLTIYVIEWFLEEKKQKTFSIKLK